MDHITTDWCCRREEEAAKLSKQVCCWLGGLVGRGLQREELDKSGQLRTGCFPCVPRMRCACAAAAVLMTPRHCIDTGTPPLQVREQLVMARGDERFSARPGLEESC